MQGDAHPTVNRPLPFRYRVLGINFAICGWTLQPIALYMAGRGLMDFAVSNAVSSTDIYVWLGIVLAGTVGVGLGAAFASLGHILLDRGRNLASTGA